MIEEASGTSLYQSKKENSLKIITKKSVKEQEIQSIIETEINPHIQKLRKDRDQYELYRNNQSLIEKLEKQINVFVIYQATFQKQQKRDDVIQLRNQGDALVTQIDNSKYELDQIDEQIKQIRQNVLG
jgi:structural maintenance of chromosome 2